MKAVVLFFFVMFSTVVFAQGEAIPCPNHKVGSKYQFEYRYNNDKPRLVLHTITAVNTDTIGYVHWNGGQALADKVFNTMRSGSGVLYTPKIFDTLECPFQLGEKRVYKDAFYTVNGIMFSGSYTVAADSNFTTMTVRGGTFRTIRMVMKFEYNWSGANFSSGTGKIDSVSYYAPEIGNKVKKDATELSSGAPAATHAFELTRYLIP